MNHDREIDVWLRRMAIVGPITAFIVGWGSGVVTAFAFYREVKSATERNINDIDRIREENMVRDKLLAVHSEWIASHDRRR